MGLGIRVSQHITLKVTSVICWVEIEEKRWNWC